VDRLASDVKKVLPGVRIIFGGPEVSFNTVDFMRSHPYVDYILSGEAEDNLPELLKAIDNGSVDGFTEADTKGLTGLTFRKNTDILSDAACPFPLIRRLESLPSPYNDEMLQACSDRIIYFESSRGCPFKCSYCLSPATGGVRYYPMDRVKQELSRFARNGARLVKFVDRTFNCDPARAKELFRFIISGRKIGELQGTYHFETAPDLFDEEMIDILSYAPPGLIQFETGIQTLNDESLQIIGRRMDTDRSFYYINKLVAAGNLHIHADLIAGLPKEDLPSFRDTFDRVYRLAPHRLQLGLLKCLKGSRIASESGLYGYGFSEYPPYPVLFSNDLSFSDVMLLTDIADYIDRFYNSGRFAGTMVFIMKHLFNSPFAFFEDLRKFFISFSGRKIEENACPRSTREQYDLLYRFITYIAGANRKMPAIVFDLLKYDFLCSDKSCYLPNFISQSVDVEYKARCVSFLKEALSHNTFPGLFNGLSLKQVLNSVHFEEFKFDILDEKLDPDSEITSISILFDYNSKNSVTGRYSYRKIVDKF